MHDPLTLAFEIKSPFREPKTKMFPDGYRHPLISIWHKDPCRGRGDDSCGWAWPRLTDAQEELLSSLAFNEAVNPYFLDSLDRKNCAPRGDIEIKLRGLLLLIAKVLNVKLTFDQAAAQASLYVHGNEAVGTTNLFYFLPGYHTNNKEDRVEDRKEFFLGLLCCLARTEVLGPTRRWWQHPRWHFWHWRIVIHPLREVWRWAFDRCRVCGKRFAWQESRVSDDWDGYRIRHASCDQRSSVTVEELEA